MASPGSPRTETYARTPHPDDQQSKGHRIISHPVYKFGIAESNLQDTFRHVGSFNQMRPSITVLSKTKNCCVGKAEPHAGPVPDPPMRQRPPRPPARRHVRDFVVPVPHWRRRLRFQHGPFRASTDGPCVSRASADLLPLLLSGNSARAWGGGSRSGLGLPLKTISTVAISARERLRAASLQAQPMC